MKACMLWEKDTASHIDKLKLEPLVKTPKDFAVVDAGSEKHKLTINAVISTPAYPNNSKKVGLKKTP
jgi:hypothetical protein